MIYIEISSLTSKDKRQCTSPSSILSTRNVQLCRNDNDNNNEHDYRISELQKHIKRTERSFNDKSLQYESQIESYNKKFNEYMIYINIINKFIDNVVSFINSHISDVSLLPFINTITVQQNNNMINNDVIGVRLQPEEFRSVLSQIETYIYDITKDAIYSKVRYNKLLEVNNELICNNKVLTEANEITREYDNGKTFGVQRCDTFNALERRVNVLEKKMQRVNGRGRGGNSKSNRHYVSTNVSLNNALKLHDKDKPKSNSKRKFKCTVVGDNDNNYKERNIKSALHSKPKTTKKKTKKLNKSNNIDNIITPNITTTFIHTTNNKHTRNYTQSNTNTNANNKYKTYLN